MGRERRGRGGGPGEDRREGSIRRADQGGRGGGTRRATNLQGPPRASQPATWDSKHRVMPEEEGIAEKKGSTRRAEPDEEALFFPQSPTTRALPDVNHDRCIRNG